MKKWLLAALLIVIAVVSSACVNGQVVLPQKKAPAIGIAVLPTMIMVGVEDDPNPVILLEEYSCPECAKWEAENGRNFNGTIMDGRLTVGFAPVNVQDQERSLKLTARLYDVASKGNPAAFLQERERLYGLMNTPDRGKAEIDSYPIPSEAGLRWAAGASGRNITSSIEKYGYVKTPTFSRDITDDIQ